MQSFRWLATGQPVNGRTTGFIANTSIRSKGPTRGIQFQSLLYVNQSQLLTRADLELEALSRIVGNITLVGPNAGGVKQGRLRVKAVSK